LRRQAVRECLEETGVRCSNLQPLAFFYPGMDVSNNPTHIFFSDSVLETNQPREMEISEMTHFEWVPLEECIEMILRHEIQDSFTMLGLLAYKSILYHSR
jgi:8-oxo-dGTP pyrophosphatase MutT (NUDIX family)